MEEMRREYLPTFPITTNGQVFVYNNRRQRRNEKGNKKNFLLLLLLLLFLFLSTFTTLRLSIFNFLVFTYSNYLHHHHRQAKRLFEHILEGQVHFLCFYFFTCLLFSFSLALSRFPLVTHRLITMIDDLFKHSTLRPVCFVSQMLPFLTACVKRMFPLTVLMSC
jgi:hypothetical protein